MKNVRKHRKVKVFGVRTKLSYYNVFHRKSVRYRNEKKKKTKAKTQIVMNITFTSLCKIQMSEEAKLCYMNTGSFIGLMKDELGEKIMIKFVGLRAKAYSYLTDDGIEDKKSKRHRKVCHKKNINLSYPEKK